MYAILSFPESVMQYIYITTYSTLHVHAWKMKYIWTWKWNVTNFYEIQIIVFQICNGEKVTLIMSLRLMTVHDIRS